MMETTQKILKEDGTDIMQLNKSIFIHNTAAYPTTITIMGTTIIQAIEENTWAISMEIKELQERISQLEIENNQLKVQASSSTTVVSIMEYFKRCALEQVEELYKVR